MAAVGQGRHRHTVTAKAVAVALLAAVLPLVAPTTAGAATFTVTTTADVIDGGDGVLSFREAFIAANAAPGLDTIVLQPAAIYTLGIPGALEDAAATGDLDSIGDLVIEGNGATIDAAGLDRVIDATAPLTVRDLTITGGFVDSSLNDASVAGGGVRATTAIFESSTIRDNQVQATTDDPTFEVSGGGIWGDDLTVTDSTVADNAVVFLQGIGTSSFFTVGGGIASFDATVTGSTISGNTVRRDDDGNAAVGGGLWASTLSMSDTTVSANSAIGFGIGGGIAAGDSTIADSIITDNTVDGTPLTGVGGGVSMKNGLIARTEISGNAIVGGVIDLGGGLATDGTVTLVDSDVYDNKAGNGAGVFSEGNLTIESSTIRDNVATGTGGGVLAGTGYEGLDPTTTIRDSTIVANTADSGAGVSLSDPTTGDPATLRIERSLVADNVAASIGGGLSVEEGAGLTAVVESSTVSGNTAATGGGFWLGSPTALTDSTVTANTATTSGGGVWLDPTGAVTGTNSVVGDQIAGVDCGGAGTVVSSGFNADTDGSCGLGDPTDLTVGSLGLGALADNGGPTLSHRPLPGSALVDSGPAGCLATDQRGVARPVGAACDRGAIETSYLAPTTTADVVDGGDGVLSLREAVDLANASGVDDEIVLGAGLTYELSICGSGEDANATGDLDHTAAEALTITGTASTIDQGCVAAAGDRILQNGLGALSLDGLTITGGDTTSVLPWLGRGGGVFSAGDTTVVDVSFVANTSGGDGGGLAIGYAAVTVTSSAFAGNVAVGDGGGLYQLGDAVDDTVDISGSDFLTNTAGYSGGGLAVDNAGGVAKLTSLTVDSNISARSGAGVEFYNTDADLNSSVVTANRLTGAGLDPFNCTNGAGLSTNRPIDIDRSDISNNSSTAACTRGIGVQISESSGLSTVRMSSISGNFGSAGSRGVGAGLFAADLFLMEDSVIDGNTLPPTGMGGGVFLVDGGTIRRSTISNNSSGAAGGLFVYPDTLIEDSLIVGNVADVVGGLCVADGLGQTSVTLRNSTVVGNSSTGESGAGGIGFACAGGGSLLLESSTVVGNVGPVANIESSSAAGTVAMTGSVVGDPVGGPDCSLVVPLVSGGSNFDSDGSCGLAGAGDVSGGGDPGLLFLADNGGPTFSRLPLPWSPLVDAAVGCGGLGSDQRGVARPQGAACDIGAVELVGGEWSPAFVDVGQGHPFLVEIEWAAALGVAQGWPDQTFRSTEQISRQAVAVWLWRLAGEPAPVGPSPFSDTAGSIFEPAIVWLAEQGVVQGWPDGTFRPTERVSRQAVAVWLWRLAGEPAPVGPSPFTDTAGSPFEPAIVWLAEQGVAQGWPDGTFRPVDRVSRQAVAAWVCRYADLGLP